MRVFLPRLNLGPHVDIPVDEFERLAAHDRIQDHHLVAEPGAADIILFSQCHMVDWRLRSIRTHPVAKAHWNKVMVYDERDRPWRSFPGVYVSVPRGSFDRRYQRSWGYFRGPDVPDGVNDPVFLYSFVGSMSHPCRRPILELRHPEAVVEEVPSFMFWDTSQPDFYARRARFKSVLAQSRFILCPRGRGTSSFRVYESLAAGRVPVIISDEWVPPDGPDWGSISIRWPEGRTSGLVEVLEERVAAWKAMSAAARIAYREFFAPDVAFHRVVECCADLQKSMRTAQPRATVLEMRSIAAAASDLAKGRADAFTPWSARLKKLVRMGPRREGAS